MKKRKKRYYSPELDLVKLRLENILWDDDDDDDPMLNPSDPHDPGQGGGGL